MTSLLFQVAVVVMFASVSFSQMTAPPPSGQGMNMNMNVNNFNLSSMPGILAFLNAEGINPSSIVVPNCIRNGDPCSASSTTPCCLSPVFTCQQNRNGPGNACYVIPAHAPHIPQIRQIVNFFGMTTDQPIQ